MLANKDLYEEIQKFELVVKDLEKQGQVFEAALLKSNILILKLLHSLRTNSVTLMKHSGVELEQKSRPSSSPETTKDI